MTKEASSWFRRLTLSESGSRGDTGFESLSGIRTLQCQSLDDWQPSSSFHPLDQRGISRS